MSKRDSSYVGLWLPDSLKDLLDSAVQDKDLDRSKYIRAAIKERLCREGRLVSAEGNK